MATKKHKKRRRDTRTEEQKAQSARDLAQAAAQPQKKAGVVARATGKAADKPKAAKQVAKAEDKNKKPSLWKRFVNYCKEVKAEMQRVVWPTRPELVNASLVVVGALIFFGVGIAIIDNIIIIPLDAIASLGVNYSG